MIPVVNHEKFPAFENLVSVGGDVTMSKENENTYFGNFGRPHEKLAYVSQLEGPSSFFCVAAQFFV